MKSFIFLAVFAYFFGPGVLLDNGNKPSENQINAEHGNISSSTATPTITTPDITSTTQTTAKPSTATTKSTTWTSTTPYPSTPTILPTTPYPPAETGDLKIGTWNTSCIVVRMGVKFTFMYGAKNQIDVNRTLVLNMPNDTTADVGWCGPENQTLSIPFYSDWLFSITFRKNGTDFAVSELNLTFSMNSHYFPNISEERTEVHAGLNNVPYMTSHINSSYQCYHQAPLTFSGSPLQSIEFAKLQLEAFRNSNTSIFSDPVPCAADTEINNIVPIAVGAALGGLVIIVLIAYLIGRKRSRRGYESV